MKYLSHVVSLLLGGAVTAIGFLVIFPPSSIDLGIELGRKLGLDAAEKRYADYEDGHEVLTVQAEKDKNRADAAESALSGFRDRSYAEVARLKNVAQVASRAQEQAIKEQVALQSDLDSAWGALDQSTSSSDQATQKAVYSVKLAAGLIYNGLKTQLEAAGQENYSLRHLLALRDQEIVALSASRDAWKTFAYSEKKLREDAESYIADVKDSGFYFGVGALAGAVKTISGESGPGAGIGITLGWRFL